MAKVFQVKSGRVCRVKVPSALQQAEQTGKTIVFVHEGCMVVGVCKAVTSAGIVVDMAIPDAAGVLHVTGTEVVLGKGVQYDVCDNLKVSLDAVRIKAWEASLVATLGKDPSEETKSYAVHADPKDDKSTVVDYKDVTLEGYLSTFVGTTPKDRDGDYVMDGAFDKTLAAFRENPVMLLDHRNAVESLAGSFTKIGVNDTGLAVRAVLSNAPGLRDTRFKVAEGHLRTLSMGGLFYYNDDGKGIREVELYEGSLTPVPSNKDAKFTVRSVTASDVVKMYERKHVTLK